MTNKVTLPSDLSTIEKYIKKHHSAQTSSIKVLSQDFGHSIFY